MPAVPSDCQLRSVSRVREALAPKHWMTFGAATALAPFANYRFFTPAVLYLWGALGGRGGQLWEEPLVQFLAEYPKPAHYLHHRFNQPLFSGLSREGGDGEWNYALWAIEAEAFEAFQAFMLSLAFYDPKARQLVRVASQSLTIDDPLWADAHPIRTPQTPSLAITAFGLNASWGCVGLWAASPLDRPAVVRTPPRPETLRFATALFAGDNPVLSLEDPGS